MTFQAHDGLSARSEELHRHILRSHLAYLNQEETPAKLQQRHNLESLISEFLSVVSHNAKFTFFEVSKILNGSIENNVNFSAYKAGSAFEALEKYATNLISHPWRKEYKTVKLYSGFYKHSVESQLLDGSSVFHLLGYQFTDEGILYLDEPVDPDKVARVALDCLTAYVECQIMLQICERVKAFKCTWFDIHQIRQDYICGIDESIRILHQLKRNELEQEKQDRWIREQENGFPLKSESGSNYQKTGILVDVSNTWPSNGTYPGYSTALAMQPSVGGSYSTKSHKSSQFSHSKLPSWSEGVSSQISDYRDRNFISKSDETDGYASRSLDDHSQPGYNFLSKCNNSTDSRYTNSDLTPESWKDSWDALQPSPYHDRHDSAYLSCDREGYNRTGYNNTVPNVKETYSSHFGHLYPSHPMIPLGLPAYPIPHDFTIPPQQCQCQMCCDHQLSVIPHKYHFMKDGGDDFEPTPRRPSSNRIESNHLDDPTEMCSSFLKMSVDAPNPGKSRHFPPVASAFTPYQSNSNDVVLRSSGSGSGGNKTQQNTSKRGSYYDNVPASPFDGEVNSSFSLVGQSLTPKCDFQTNGTLPSTALSSKSRSLKGATTTDTSTLSSSKPLLKKSYSNSSAVPVLEHRPVPDLAPSKKSYSNSSSVPVPDLHRSVPDQAPSKKSYSNSSAVPTLEHRPVQDQAQGVTVTSGSDSKNVKPQLTSKESKSGSKKWSCTSCTFYNAPEKSICDMCGRSKMPGPEITPLVSGGRECPQCTLVNKKDCEDCTACGASLKDSPTYI